MSSTIDMVARKVAIHHEIDSRAEWNQVKWASEQATDTDKALAMVCTLADFAGTARAGNPDRARLLRIAGACQAWVEHLDAEAAR